MKAWYQQLFVMRGWGLTSVLDLRDHERVIYRAKQCSRT